MAETWVESQCLQDIAQQRFPSLSAEQAYVALFREIVLKYPAKAMELVGPDAIEALITMGKIDPKFWVLIPLGRLGKKMSEHFMPWFDSLSADATLSSAQRSVQMIGELSSDTSGPSNPVIDVVKTTPAGATLRVDNMKNVAADLTDNSIPPASSSPAPGESLFGHINHFECWNMALRATEVAQMQQAIKALKQISDHLGDRNCIAVSGAGGPDGFAQPVYDLINMKINDIDQEDRNNHRFFVFHDSTNWHPAFNRLTRENPLPPEFVNPPSESLDLICLFMREVRQNLTAQDQQRGKAIIFHLLIPSWSKLHIKTPLHFHEDLYPLKIEGLKHGGKDQVELNLPAAPPGLLHDIANVIDPYNWNKIARGASVGITLPTVGWGVNGACLGLGVLVGTFTGIGVVAAVPIWWGTGLWAMGKTAIYMDHAIYDSLCEEAPRVLGSTERLGARE